MRPWLWLLFLVPSCAPQPAWAEVGFLTYYTTASCQSEGTSGLVTASGEPYDESACTLALPHRDFGGVYRVRSLTTGKTLVARHTDFGPGRRPRSRGVIADATPALFRALGHDLSEGKIRVEVIRCD